MIQATTEKVPHVRVEQIALMDNHFHLLVYQEDERNIEVFMRSLMIRYAWHVRKKYSISGSIFEGSYRAVLIATRQQLQNVARYIHNNPIDAGYGRGTYS